MANWRFSSRTFPPISSNLQANWRKQSPSFPPISCNFMVNWRNEAIMHTYLVEKNEEFVGREPELRNLSEIADQKVAKIIIVYGRRRIGKTELLEQAFKDRNLLKFEGRESTEPLKQMHFVMQQLADYTGESLLSKISVSDWVEVLKYIAEKTKTGTWTVYFEELQWLANYENEFVTALKYVWDNFFKHNKQLILILCGSSPSFMITDVVRSRALYNRSQYEIALRELNLMEAKAMLPNLSLREVMDAYLTLGGMPEYLLRLQQKKSVYLILCKESFIPAAFFATEYERIFTSSLANNKHYKQIIAYLSRRKFATRSEILKHLKLSSGGAISALLEELELCGFVSKYAPYHLDSKSLLARYCISDAYLQFYFKFIEPIEHEIENGDFVSDPTKALNMPTYQQWLGYAFERFCRKYHRQIATILGFSAVKYRAGTYFSRRTNQEAPGCQIDLVFDRDDNVISICEIRYVQSKVSSKVIDEFEKKMELFPNEKNKTIQRVLITNNGPDESLERRAYFDWIIKLDELFDSHIWM